MTAQQAEQEQHMMKESLAKLRYLLTHPADLESPDDISNELQTIILLLGDTSGQSISAMPPIIALYYVLSLVIDKMIDVPLTRIITH